MFGALQEVGGRTKEEEDEEEEEKRETVSE